MSTFGFFEPNAFGQKKGQSSSPPPLGTGPMDEDCYEVFLASINKGPGKSVNGAKIGWSVEAPELMQAVIKLLKSYAGNRGKHLGEGSHITKFCICIPKGQWPITGPGQVWKAIKQAGFKKNKCFWTESAKTKRPIYRCAKMKKVCSDEGRCGPPGATASDQSPRKCPCNDFKSVDLSKITDKTTEYTASDGTEITLSHPGDFEKVMEQIVSLEESIKLKCSGPETEID